MRDLFNKVKLIKIGILMQMGILLLSGCIGGGSTTSGSTGGSGNNPTNLTTVSSLTDNNPTNLTNVVSLAITPQESQVTVGTTQQYTATATYADGSTSNVSSESSTIWSSSPESIATVNNTGLVTSLSTGFATIKVNYTDSSGNKVESNTGIIIVATPVKPGWSVSGTNDEYLSRISADSNGNVYSNGCSSYTVYLTKYDTNGNQIWKKSHLAALMSTGISADNQRNVYTTGYSYFGISGYYLAKYNESGELQWSLQESNGSLLTSGLAVSTDNKDKVYVVGTDSKGYFIAQYNASGTLLWTVESGVTYAQANAVSADSNGGVYITGYNVNNAFFIAKYNESGSLIWMNQGNTPYVQGFGISTDNNGRVYVTGGHNIYQNSGFISAYNSNNGNLLWTIDNQTKSGVGIDISADNRGNVYVLGVMGNGIYNPTGYYLAKYDAQGTLWQWSTIKTPVAGQGGVSVDNNGRVYVGGNATYYFINQYLDY